MRFPRPHRDRTRRASIGALLVLSVTGCAAGVRSAAPPASDTAVVAAVRAAALPIPEGDTLYEALVQRIGDARVVLLGEATHGTHEFYQARARITRRLIRDKGFSAVAIEGDWPDAHRVNRYVRGLGEDPSAREALAGFGSFPAWMWRNHEVLEFVEWLRSHNQALPAEQRAGFYGLDLYSLFPSMDEVTAYLEQADPAAARAARERYACFRRYGRDPQAYGQAVELDARRSCQRQVTEQHDQLLRLQGRLAPDGDAGAQDLFFSVLQNARLVRSSEQYFRSLFLPRVSTWNLRDRYMLETLESLVRHLDAPARPARLVVWAHNSHVGDARATHMGESGEWSLGQLARQRFGSQAVLVGFTTYSGTVTAASDWGEAPERKRVRPGLPDSYEAIFHATGIPAFLLTFPSPGLEPLRTPRLERAIGVIYLPQTERLSHYFHARLPDQFDAVIHFDQTRFLEPLEWRAGELGYRVPTRW